MPRVLRRSVTGGEHQITAIPKLLEMLETLLYEVTNDSHEKGGGLCDEAIMQGLAAIAAWVRSPSFDVI